MSRKLVFTYRAEKEWDGRVMEIELANPTQAVVDHYRDVMADLNHRQVDRCVTVWGGTYHGQPARDWFLHSSQIQDVEVRTETAADAA